MAKLWKPNEEVSEKRISSDHRDKEAGIQPPDTQPPRRRSRAVTKCSGVRKDVALTGAAGRKFPDTESVDEDQ